ncbi:hypothetical protein ThvES_00018230 [Thiovulum sp. ES]|nr:hypothetical protein ThvES_00018230 [Thiovulum sp. ES]
MRFLILLIPVLSFADPFGSEEEQLREIDQIVYEYNRNKAKVQKDIEIYKEDRIDEADFEAEEEEAVEKVAKPESLTKPMGFTYGEDESKTETCGNGHKPDLDDTLGIIRDEVLKDEKLQKLEEFAYLIRWFYLADQVTSEEEGGLFYLLKDSEFDEKIDALFEKSMGDDFIPTASDLIDAFMGERTKWEKYLKSIVCDFGDIDEKFYSKMKFKVSATKGLNIRENPLTGVKLPSTYVLNRSKTVYLHYFTFGTARDFTGTYESRWAKISVPTRNGNRVGWVNMAYLRKK